MSAGADSLDRDAREWVDLACSANGSVWCWTQWERCESRPLVQTWATCCGAVEYLLTKRAAIVRAKGEG